LSGVDQAIDNALRALYDSDRQGGLGSSAPNVARWLGDIRTYFPASVVRVMQQGALERMDLTEELHDPVELLFGTQLGGGTDINRALGYCQGLVRQPQETIFILISDLYEGGNRAEMLKRAAALVAAGVQVIVLLALNDDGAPSFDHVIAASLAGLSIPAFACTPDLFPELMAAAIRREEIGPWAAARGIVTSRGERS
jgi:hypothetical protein